MYILEVRNRRVPQGWENPWRRASPYRITETPSPFCPDHRAMEFRWREMTPADETWCAERGSADQISAFMASSYVGTPVVDGQAVFGKMFPD